MRTLYYGDNLKILRNRDYFPSECVDLIYLDPPFNSNRNYNVLFKDESGLEADSQIQAFEDTWHWPNAAPTYHELLEEADSVAEMLQAFHDFLHSNQMMAYLVMMAARLKELHRVLRPTGSIYLHCDPTASHYLKILLDTIFGAQNFRTEISWKRSSAHNDAKQGRMQPGNIRDTIFFYTKSDTWTWNWQYTPYSQDYINSFYKYVEEGTGRRYRLGDLTAAKPGGDTSYEFYGTYPYKGRYWAYSKQNMENYKAEGRLYFPPNGGTPSYKRYLDEMPGVPLQNDWDDIRNSSATGEYMGYPTQKPVELLERIIQASSNEGDIVLDPFAGCGTTIAAAQKTNREWIGIDVTQLSIALLKSRLERDFSMLPKRDYKVIGEPEDLHDARVLANDPDPKNRYQFQYWALSQVNATPLGGQVGGRSGKIGADRGIDGLKTFVDDNSGKAKKVVLQVKSGSNISVKDIRDLVGTVEREKAAIGVYITLEPPKQTMLDEAADAGVYKGEHFAKQYPRIQILTIEQILGGTQIDMPPNIQSSRRILPEGDIQNALFDQERDDRIDPEF